VLVISLRIEISLELWEEMVSFNYTSITILLRGRLKMQIIMRKELQEV